MVRNHYKRLDIFRCTHESHQDFGNVVSVYHVLKEKGCYPNGCVYFKWKCRKLDHKLPCPKSYEHVGKKCVSCTEYYDEKIVKHPKLLLSEEDYQLFLKDLHQFEMWLHAKKGREVNGAGVIKAVKPRFILNRQYDRTRLSFKGFLVCFQEGFIDITHLQDPFYALLSPSQQSRLRLSKGDRLEFRGTLRLDRGRIILHRVRGIEIEEKGESKAWTVVEARQALYASKMYDCQYEKCIQCPYGSLVDIQESTFSVNGPKKRKLLCLKGVSNPEYCIVQASQKLHPVDSCQSGENFIKNPV